MMYEMTQRLEDARFNGYAINLRPLRVTTPDVTGVCLRLRRTVPRRATGIEVVDQRYIHVEDVVLEIEELFDDPRRVLQYVPLTTASGDDPDNTVYWTRTACGRLAAFRNPTVPIVECDTVIPVVDDLETLLSAFSSQQHAFVRSLYPSTIDHTMDALEDRHIPYRVKSILVQLCVVCFGLRDELILKVGAMVQSRELAANPMHLDMVYMTAIMNASYLKNTTSQSTLKSLVRLVYTSDCEDTWRQWATHSPFVGYMLLMVDVSFVRGICESAPFLCTTLIWMLRSRIGHWTRREIQKATLVPSLIQGVDGAGGCGDDVRGVMEELARVNDRAQRTLMEIVHVETATRPGGPTRDTSIKGGTVQRGGDPGRQRAEREHTCGAGDGEEGRGTDARGRAEYGDEEGGVEDGTHHNVVEALSRRHPEVEWTLIGSGIFSNLSDVDVVATVHTATNASDATSALKHAYDLVRRLTGYAQRGEVDGKRVCTLYGVWEGEGHTALPIDVQVTTRGDSESERCTARAVALTTRLVRDGDAAMRRNFRHVHRWFLATDLKGTTRCHVPGVAVTCLTVGCTRGATFGGRSIAHVVEALRDRVHRDRPRVSLDEWDGEADSSSVRRRPTHPIEVLVDERNVVTRVTAAWTRHLCDTLLFSMSLTLERIFCKEVYMAWRRRSMIYCATLRPRTSTSLVLSLFQSLSRFEMHPLVDSYHVGADGPSESDVVLRCTLDENTYEGYNFRRGDTFTPYDGHVMVTRGSRTTRLNTSPGDGAAFDAAKAERMHCRCMFGTGRMERFPNAPFLSADAVLCFSPSHFTVV